MTTIAAAVEEQIVDDILRGRIAPGAKLDEQSLAARFHVSRTPVREALRQLLATGLVESIPRRGAVVASFGAERLSQLYEAIGELETLCARLAAQRMTAIERKELELALKPLEQAAASGDRDTYLRRSDALHDVIHRGCHNPFLIEVVRAYRTRSLPFRNLQPYSHTRVRSSLAERRRIVDAILAHDAEASAQAMREHVATSLLRALDTFMAKENLSPSPPPRRSARRLSA
ncbi:MAG: GntR family transcriptional regulator [Burkholderiales bacterium]|jgi:DNA-binding GntR family transcriptional regulator|nr:GntR family transcriptional regulator [Burkholderiales bacterium]